MKEKVVNLILKELNFLKKEEIENLVEIPHLKELGDYAFPCFSLAKKEKKNPMLIAEELAEKLRKRIDKKSEISGIDFKSGYVNFFVDKKILAEKILKSSFKPYKKNFERIAVEFSQPNTHKAFHVGHIRGTSIGESLARILEFKGNKVFRVNYQGDTGMHVAKWIWCYSKYHKKEKLKNDESWIALIYTDAVKRLSKNETFQKEVEEINRKLDSREDKDLNELWKKTRKLSLDSLEVIYKDLNTKFDKYYFESELENEAKTLVEILKQKKIALESDGAVIVDFKEKGFDNLGVLVLLRKDGTVLYGAKDLVLAKKKFNDFKLDRSLYIHGGEQNLHFQQFFKILEFDGFKDSKKMEHLGFSLVRLPTGKMSSRTGDNILYSDFKKEIVSEVEKNINERNKGIGKTELSRRSLIVSVAAMKYSMLKQDANKTIIFDKNEALRFEGDTGPYLLYSYARASSIIKKVKSKKAVKV